MRETIWSAVGGGAEGGFAWAAAGPLSPNSAAAGSSVRKDRRVSIIVSYVGTRVVLAAYSPGGKSASTTPLSSSPAGRSARAQRTPRYPRNRERAMERGDAVVGDGQGEG